MNVYQLHGGIIKYSEDPEAKGKCLLCGKPTDRYVNCANLNCHKQHFDCDECKANWKHTYSAECMKANRYFCFLT